jgi:hypothetical protein
MKMGRRIKNRIGTNHAVGAANYLTGTPASRQIRVPLRYIHALDDIQMWANGGYIIRPVAVAGGLITYRAYSENREAMSGALADHALHTHTITTLAAGGGVALKIVAGALDTAGGALTPVTGIQDAAAMAHAAAAAALKDIAPYEEVQDGTNLSAVTMYARAMGY